MSFKESPFYYDNDSNPVKMCVNEKTPAPWQFAAQEQWTPFLKYSDQTRWLQKEQQMDKVRHNWAAFEWS